MKYVKINRQENKFSKSPSKRVLSLHNTTNYNEWAQVLRHELTHRVCQCAFTVVTYAMILENDTRIYRNWSYRPTRVKGYRNTWINQGMNSVHSDRWCCNSCKAIRIRYISIPFTVAANKTVRFEKVGWISGLPNCDFGNQDAWVETGKEVIVDKLWYYKWLVPQWKQRDMFVWTTADSNNYLQHVFQAVVRLTNKKNSWLFWKCFNQSFLVCCFLSEKCH